MTSGAQPQRWLPPSQCAPGRAQMVELASKKFICIVDESKLVSGLGGSKGTAAHASCMCCLRCMQGRAASLMLMPTCHLRTFWS